MKKATKIVMITATSVAALSVGALTVHGYFAPKNTTGSADSDQNTFIVEKMDLSDTVTLSGTVSSAETSQVCGNITGTEISEVCVKVGDRVQKGDVIARLNTSDLEQSLSKLETLMQHTKEQNALNRNAAQRSYDSAVSGKEAQLLRNGKDFSDVDAQYQQAVADRDAAYNGYSDACTNKAEKEAAAQQAAADAGEASAKVLFLEQERLTAKQELTAAGNAWQELCGQPEPDEAAIQTAQEQLTAAEAAYTAADEAYQQAKQNAADAAANASICSQELLAAQTAEAELEMGIKSADKEVVAAEIACRKTSDAKNDIITEYDALISTNQDSLSSMRLSEYNSTADIEKQISELRKQIGQCTILADCSGVVTEVHAKAGRIYTGDVIAVIQDDSRYSISAVVDQYDIGKLSSDLLTEITVPALKNDPISGKVSFLSPTPDSADINNNAGYSIKIDMDTVRTDLRIGMSAKASVITAQKKDVLAVPEFCIGTENDGSSYVEVLEKDGAAVKTPVTVGIRNDYYTEISGEGISAGTRVLTHTEDTEEQLFY